MIQQNKDERAIGELLGDLYRDAERMVRLEVEFAKTEVTQKATRVGKNAGFLVAGAIVAYTGVLAILAGIIALLGLLIPVWISALIIGILVAGAGAFLAWKGLQTLRQESVAPQRTIDTLKEDQEWMRDQTR